MYIIVLRIDDKLYRIKAEDNIKIAVGTGIKDDINVRELGDAKLFLKIKKGLLFVSSKKLEIEEGLKISADNEQAVEICQSPRMSIRWTKDFGDSEKSYKLIYDCQVHVGRSSQNDIVISDRFVSGSHFVIRCNNGDVRIEDLNSTNHIFLNGTLIKKALMRSGDVLDILYIRIRLENYELFFENVGDKLTINSLPELSKDSYAREQDSMVFHRSPRIRDRLPNEDITLSRIPLKGRRSIGKQGRLSSLVSSGAMVGASLAMGAFSPAMLAMRAAMLVSPVSYMIGSSGKKEKKKERELEEERIKKYSSYIIAEKAHIQAIADTQREIINNENPEPSICLMISNELKPNLWERCPVDSDFLMVRMGEGYEKLCVNVKPPADNNEFRMEQDELEALSDHIIQETKYVDNVSARLDFKNYNTVGIIGTRKKVINLVKNMLVSLCTLHYHKDVKIIGIFDKEETLFWSSLRWLPHIWDKDKQTRFLSFESIGQNDPDTGNNKESVSFEEFCDRVGGIFSERSDKEYRKMNDSKAQLPHYIVILGSQKKTEHLELMKYLTSNDQKLGVTTLFLYDQLYNLPQQCQYIVNVDDDYDDMTASAYSKSAGNEKIWFTLDPNMDDEAFDHFCRMQSAVEVNELFESGEIPSALTFFQCMDAESPTDLNIWENWCSSSPDKVITAPIGKSEGGKTFYLSAPSRFKSHGLVAGMTGSGKSEMLLSWMLSIACHYNPRDVSFVIIDYKGGSMARAIQTIPHVAGVITDNGEGIRRCFQSLQHEIIRRKDILGKYNVKDIDDYIPKYHKGEVNEVLPRLMIVVDEFKELKKERPEIMSMIDSIAAQGSALGVHLVLATQSPEDAVDEGTWKNTSYQICLRVKSAAASKAMIREPVAAFISQAGRAYVRVGTDESTEVFQLIQSAWSGAPYRENRKSGGYEVRLVEMNGERVKTIEDNQTRFKSDKTEISAVCDHICKIAKEHNILKNSSLWYEEIPKEFSLEYCRIKGGFNGATWDDTGLPWLKIPIGLYDSPEKQEQDVQYIDFQEDGHFGIFGAPGKGKTTFLKTLVCSACSFYTPKDINIYVIDLSGLSMNIIRDFPHVGGVVLDGEDEKFFKLMKMLDNLIENRKKIFSEEKVDSLKSYREVISDDMPAVLLIINNFSLVLEQYPDNESDFIKIIKQGITYGIYVIYTGGNNNGVKYKIYSDITSAICFELGGKSDYSGLLGQLNDVPFPSRPGRALFKIKNGQRDIQAAMFADGDNDIERNDNIRKLANKMDQAWTGNRSPRIPVVPEHLTMDMMLSQFNDKEKIPVGYDCINIEPAFVNLDQSNNIAVIGDSEKEKSEYLIGLCGMIRKAFDDTIVYVFDSSEGNLRELDSSGNYYDEYNTDIDFIIEEIITKLSERKKEGHNIRDLPLICIFIDNIQFIADTMPENSQEKLDRIFRLSKGLGLATFTSIDRAILGEMYNNDQLVRDIVDCKSAIMLSGSAMSIESYYKHGFNAINRMEELKNGYALLFDEQGADKIKIAKRS